MQKLVGSPWRGSDVPHASSRPLIVSVEGDLDDLTVLVIDAAASGPFFEPLSKADFEAVGHVGLDVDDEATDPVRRFLQFVWLRFLCRSVRQTFRTKGTQQKRQEQIEHLIQVELIN